MREGLFDEAYKIRKELLQKGIRKDLPSWIEAILLDKDKAYEHTYRAYLEAGFRNFKLIRLYLEEFGVDVHAAIKVRDAFLSAGADQKSAEEWMLIGSKHPRLALELFKLGVPFETVEKLIEAVEKILFKDNQEGLDFFREKDYQEGLAFFRKVVEIFSDHGFTLEETYCELANICCVGFLKQEELIEAFEGAKEKGVKSLYLYSSLWSYGYRSFDIFERINFYTSLGIPRIKAEWWVAEEHEASHKYSLGYKPLTENQVLEWLAFGVKDLKDIIRMVRLYYHFKAFLKVGNPFKSACLWYKSKIPTEEIIKGYSRYAIEHSFERAQEWYELDGLGLIKSTHPEVFKKFLLKSECDVHELVDWWIELNQDYNRLEEWFSAGVKDYISYKALLTLGIKPQETKELIEVFGLERLLQMIDEGKTKEEIFKEKEEHLHKKALKKVVNLFKKK